MRLLYLNLCSKAFSWIIYKFEAAYASIKKKEVKFYEKVC